MAATQPFQPRELTEEQKAKLVKVEQKVDKHEAEIDYWSNEVKKAPVGSEERKEAQKERDIARAERDNAQTQLKELKVEFGQVPGLRSEYVDVSEKVAAELVGDPLSELPPLDKLSERLEREIPCCYPEEAFFVDRCRRQYRAERSTEISDDTSSFMFLKKSPQDRVDPGTLSLRPVLIKASDVVVTKSEDTIHSFLTPLMQYVLTGLLTLLKFSWFEPSQSFTRNQSENKRSRTTMENLRPDWMFFIHQLLVIRGEEKAEGANASLEQAASELISKMDTWHTLFFGELPYVFGYACCGTQFQFYALHPNKTVSRPGGVPGVNLTKIGNQLDLAFVDERFRLLKYIINLVRVFEVMEHQIPEDAPPLGDVSPPWKRPLSGEYSTIVFEPGFVVKILNLVHSRVSYDYPMLQDLYKIIKAGKIRYSILCQEGYPKLEPAGNAVRLHLYPIGLPVYPKTEEELKTCLSHVLEALQDLHKHLYCHRDVRWPNILKNIDKSWMLIDFDFAARLKGGKAEWPTWTRGVPTRKRSENWSASHDIMQVARLLEDDDLKWFERRGDLSEQIKASSTALAAHKKVESFFK